MTTAAYVGRFAPSPTGHLHFGSLLAAMASYCDARSANGQWLLRIDDIDPPREMLGATKHFTDSLRAYGFVWDAPLIKQSDRSQLYLSALDQLNKQANLFTCQCARKILAGRTVYPGHCRKAENSSDAVQRRLATAADRSAIRVIIDADVKLEDLIQGQQLFNTTTDIGDTIVFRKDNLFSYALACAVDDADGVTRVVRGADLLPTTAVQMAIMKLLNLSSPEYAHIPVVLNSQRQKLSKQTQATSIDDMPVLPTLLHAWRLLGQPNMSVSSIATFWRSAIENWDLTSVPKLSQLHEAV